MTTQDTIREIKAQFRLFMNGVASHSMREKGLDYKLNFGIELPRLKEISLRYEKNHSLAVEVWKENIRECKILATLLQPIVRLYNLYPNTLRIANDFSLVLVGHFICLASHSHYDALAIALTAVSMLAT
jgi:3-methyladenine DNA glycosylase AlkD